MKWKAFRLTKEEEGGIWKEKHDVFFIFKWVLRLRDDEDKPDVTEEKHVQSDNKKDRLCDSGGSLK